MAGQYILAHDLGTSGNKATIYDFKGNLCASVLCEYPTYYPQDGFVEQDPNDWWRAVCLSTKRLLQEAGIRNTEIAVVSFSAQMMGCLLVDHCGEALRKMIIWADTRSVQQEAEMIDKIGMERGYHITGHRLSASYGGAKLLWIKENEPDIYHKAYKMLNAKDYIIHRLTGAFVTDYSDASGTNLFDLERKMWSEEIVNALDLRMDLLPEVHASTDIAGGITPEAAMEIGLLAGTPVVIGGGDGSCACVGAGVVEEGKTYNVLGSSSWISIASKTPVFDPAMRTFNWIHLDPDLYTPCGTMQAAGYSLNWFKNVFCKDEIKEGKVTGKNPYQLIDKQILQTAPGANGLLYLPYLLGERSPRWNFQAKGAFIGMKITTTKADFARAVLEGVGYNLKVILDVFDKTYPVSDVVLIGGGAKGEVWAQILADIWQKPVLIPRYLEEATSMGAAICGGVGIGAFSNFSVIKQFNSINKTIVPNLKNGELYNKLYKAFNVAYNGLLDTYNMLNMND